LKDKVLVIDQKLIEKLSQICPNFYESSSKFDLELITKLHQFPEIPLSSLVETSPPLLLSSLPLRKLFEKLHQHSLYQVSLIISHLRSL
jgi:hypothetical protein